MGRILGVDAIASGSVTDLGTNVKVNARLIATETGSVFAVAAVKIAKDATVKKLMQKVSSVARTKPAVPTIIKPITPTSTKKETATSNNIVFYEDFSEVEEGMAPAGWLGTEHVMVKSSGKKRYLVNFEKGSNRLVIPNISLPDDFKIEWYCTYRRSSWDGKTEFSLIVGNVNVGLKSSYYHGSKAWINNTAAGIDAFRNQTFLMSLGKKRTVFRLFMDGSQVVLARVRKFQKPNSIVFDFGDYPFELYKISISEL